MAKSLGPTYLPPASGAGADPPVKRPGGSPSGGGSARGFQDLGSPIGRRGAGLTTVGGGDQGSHTFNYYGKKGPPGMVGGTL